MLVAAAPFTGAGGQDDVLVSPMPEGTALAAAALARSNPGVVTDAGRLTPVTPPARHASPGRWRCPPRQRPPRGTRRDGSRERRSAGVLLAALVPLALVAMALMGSALGGGPGGLIPDATSTPDLAVVPPPTPSPTRDRRGPSRRRRPSRHRRRRRRPPGRPRRPRTTAEPPTPRPTREPTPSPRPAPTAAPVKLSAPARAVERFYGAVEDHDWDLAIALWSPSMRERYPPDEWLIGRFRRTTRIDIPRLVTRSVNLDAGTANVAVKPHRVPDGGAVTADVHGIVGSRAHRRPLEARPAALLARARVRLVRALDERLEQRRGGGDHRPAARVLADRLDRACPDVDPAAGEHREHRVAA